MSAWRQTSGKQNTARLTQRHTTISVWSARKLKKDTSMRMLTEKQVAVLLSYGNIIGDRFYPANHHDVKSAFVTRGFHSYWEVCLMEDYIGFGDDWEARRTGDTLDKAFEKCIERARNHHRYQEWADKVHTAISGLLPEVDENGEPVVYQEAEPDVFAPKKLPSNSSRCYFFEDSRFFSGASKRYHKRNHNRYIRRETTQQLREAV